ncbi:MAG: hypothetical protein ACTSRU_13010 [Candidatus Hodarchaeales archaeon]
MSYIRSTSNPEELYVWGTGSHTHISSKSVEWTIPDEIFITACERYVDDDWDYDKFDSNDILEVDGFRIQDCVPCKNDEKCWFCRAIEAEPNIHPEKCTCGICRGELHHRDNCDGKDKDLKTKLTWDGEELFLWDVTWWAVTSRFENVKKSLWSRFMRWLRS